MTSEKIPSGNDVAAMYIRIRAKLEHEDNLIGQRLGWLLSAQGFFFVALGLFANSPNLPSRVTYELVLAILGVTVSLVVLSAIINSSNAIHEAQAWWFKATNGLDTSQTPPLIGKPNAFADARFAFYGIPVITFFIWVVVLAKAIVG